MNANWTDFNNADSQTSFDLIPKGTIASVRMSIKPGGYDDPNRGWTGGYATHKPESGAIYISCEFVITVGQYARRKVWSLIGLFSPKGPEWGNMGRSFVRAILNSSRGISEKDTSPQAAQARCIRGLADLDGIEFLAKIDVEKDQNDDQKNVIKFAITPDHKEYKTRGNSGGTPPAPAQQHAPPQQQAPAQQYQPPAQQAPEQQYQPPAQQQPPVQQAQEVPQRPQWAQ